MRWNNDSVNCSNEVHFEDHAQEKSEKPSISHTSLKMAPIQYNDTLYALE